jgi:hypothetical protein
MYISWEGPLTKLNPKFGLDLQETHQNGIPVPNYGNFGGPLNSGGDPVDKLDGFFEIHDGAIGDAIVRGNGVPSPEDIVEAHAQLFGEILSLKTDDDGLLKVERTNGEIVADPEATLYAGFTLFGLTAHVIQLDELDGPNNLLGRFEDKLDPALNVSTVLTRAAEYMETGLEAVPSNEVKSLNGLFHIWEKQFDDFIA